MAVGYDATRSQGAAKYPDPIGHAGVVDEIFKKFYLPAIRDQLNSKRVLARYLRRNSEAVAGEHAVLALRIGRNEGQGFIGEKGKLPDPGKQQYRQAVYAMRYQYGRILFTGPAVAASRTQKGAFIKVMDGEMRGLSQDMQHENNRVMYGDGSGVLAKVTSNTATEIVVQDPGGFTNVGPGTQYLRPGMRISVVVGGVLQANTSGQLAYPILSVDYDAQEITIDDGTGSPEGFAASKAGGLIVRASEVATSGLILGLDTSYGNEVFGLAALVDEGSTSLGVNPGEVDGTTDIVWNAPVIDTGGVPTPFHQDMLQRGMDLLDQVGDSTVQLWMTTHGIRREYVSQLVANKRYVGTETLDGGFRAVLYDGIPMVVDKDMTKGRVYGLNLDSLMLFTETDFHWIDADGGILNRLDNYDAFQATLCRYWQMGTDKRNASVVIKDIEDA